MHKERTEPGVTWEILPIDLFQEHAPQWDALQRSSVGIPFLESAFLLPLLKEFGTGHELLALESSQGRLRAACILTKTRPGFWQTFQPSQLPLGAWISETNVDLPMLELALIRALPGFNFGVGLTQLDPILQARPDDRPGIKTLDYINTAWVDIEEPFEVYWEGRGKNLKTNTRKQRSKLQAEGTIPTLECITTPERVAGAMQDYGTLESAGWKAKDGTAVHPGNAQGRFYQQMLENFCAQGHGRIYRYRFGDKVVAMDLCIESEERIVILKTSYDESYKSVSPSTLMRQDQFQALFNERRLKRIEFYGKVMEWHTRWTDNARTLYHVTAYRWSVLETLHRRIKKWRHGNSHSE